VKEIGRILTVILAFSLSASVGLAQGTLSFATRIPGALDAPVFGPFGQRITGGFEAQLFGGPAGLPKASLTPLLPITMFQDSPKQEAGHVWPVVVMVPGVMPGDTANVFLRVRASSEPGYFADSNLITVSTGGGGLAPGSLIGLESLTIGIPEPAPAHLAVLICLCATVARFWRRSTN
jgi:hypothetical protein